MMRRLWLLAALLVGLLIGPLWPQLGLAQLDPDLREAVVRAAVQIALPVIATDDDGDILLPIPVGSGTIISADGLVLTNQHVVDPADQAATVERWERQIQQEFPEVSLRIDDAGFTLLGTDGSTPPLPLYTAAVATEDDELDLAILRITGDADGDPVASIPAVPIGDSDTVELGDPVQIFSYPAIGEDSLTYTTGVISGFIFDADTQERRWLSTDAVISGGSSGGTAFNAAGELIGIPTAGSELDCRPGDTNRDGVVDGTDVGCIPTGGSLGRLIPANVAARFIARADLQTTVSAVTDATSKSPLPTAADPADETAAEAPAGSEVILRNGFDRPGGFREVDEPSRAIANDNGQLLITIKEPGVTSTFSLDEFVTGDEDVRFGAAVGRSDGQGEILLTAETADAAQWYFAIDPVAESWSLYRDSDDTEELFYWVEPISYAGQLDGPLQSVAIERRAGQTGLLLNGVDVVASSGVPLPDLGGALIFGFGAGINPASPNGFGETFVVAFDQIELLALE